MLINDIVGLAGLRVKASAPVRPPWLHSDTAWPTFDTMAEDWSLRKLQRRAMQCSWVYSDVNLIARKVGAGRFRMMQESADGASEQVQGHEFTKLMKSATLGLSQAAEGYSHMLA